MNSHGEKRKAIELAPIYHFVGGIFMQILPGVERRPPQYSCGKRELSRSERNCFESYCYSRGTILPRNFAIKLRQWAILIFKIYLLNKKLDCDHV